MKPLPYSCSDGERREQRRHRDEGHRSEPFHDAEEALDLGERLVPRVDEDRVGAGLDVGVGPGAGVLDAVAGDQALDPGDEHEVVGLLGALGRLDPAGLLVARDQLALRVGPMYRLFRLGNRLSSTAMAEIPARSYSTSVRTTLPSPPKPLSQSAMTGRSVARSIRTGGVERLGHRRQVEVGQGVGHRGHAEPADPDGVEAVRRR